jgi:hypothetical protein
MRREEAGRVWIIAVVHDCNRMPEKHLLAL